MRNWVLVCGRSIMLLMCGRLVSKDLELSTETEQRSGVSLLLICLGSEWNVEEKPSV